MNFLSAVFFGVHMLRTEHIARNTDKEKFLPLLGYEVSGLSVWVLNKCNLLNLVLNIERFQGSEVLFRYVLLLSHQQYGILLEVG